MIFIVIIMENTKESLFKKNRQLILYLVFAILMIFLSILIKYLNLNIISVIIEENEIFYNLYLIQVFYLSTDPINMRILVGSILAVGITFIIKFLLDKFIVFRKKELELKETAKQFSLSLIFSIITTFENVIVDYLIFEFIIPNYIISTFIALTIGYLMKFLLDSKYTFK